MSYFIADDKLPVLQQQVSIPSENGLSYNSTQTIELNIPAGTKFIIDSSGNVGIGTTTPTQDLHVVSSANYQGIFLNGSNAITFIFSCN